MTRRTSATRLARGLKSYKGYFVQIGNFCDAKANIVAQKAFLAHMKGETKSVECDICEELCKWIEDYGVNKGLDAIKNYVDGKCDDVSDV